MSNIKKVSYFFKGFTASLISMLLALALSLVATPSVASKILVNNGISDEYINCLRVSLLAETMYTLRAKGATLDQISKTIEDVEENFKDQLILHLVSVDVYAKPIPTDPDEYDNISFQLKEKTLSICQVSYDIPE